MQQSTGEPVVDVLVSKEKFGEVIQLTPPARLSDGIAEQLADSPIPQVPVRHVQFVKGLSNKRVQQSTEEQIVDVPVPPARMKIGEVILPCPQEQISDRNGEQIVDVPGPQIRQTFGR